MMTRCIDQFHKPRECNEACIETEKIANELKKLVTSLDGNESIGSGHCGETEVEKPLITYPVTSPHCSVPTVSMAEERYPPWKRPRLNSRQMFGGIIAKGCDCSKRNGLQDNCKRSGCGRPACSAIPVPLCAPSGYWKKPVTKEEAEEIIAKLDNPNATKSPYTIPECETKTAALNAESETYMAPCCKYGEANRLRASYY